MTTNDQVRALVSAHMANDHQRFRANVLAIAAHAEAKSPAFAKTLRALAERQPVGQMIQLPTDAKGTLEISQPTTRLDDMVLDSATRASLNRVLTEQDHRDRLAENGLRPASKLLLVGPPGVGKTMAAAVLACELGIPLLKVQLHAVISSHLGETAVALAKVFESVRVVRGVYMFDEFDALAAERRGGRDDVGEMRRVVNSLLQFIEDDTSDSLIVAATNHQDMIDRAMFRRFDAVISFPLPDEDVAIRLIQSKLLHAAVAWDLVRESARGIGHADLEAACTRVNKDAILENRITSSDELIAAIRDRGPMEVQAARG